MTEARRVNRMSDDELKTFVREFLAGMIFTSAQVERPGDVALVFMPVALGALSRFGEEGTREIGAVWEYISKAGPRSINGCPCFFSMHVMHREDWKIALRVIEREQRRLDDISLDVDEDEPDEHKQELEVALDVVNDGDAPQETLAWALGVLESCGVVVGPQMLARSTSLSWSESGSLSWSESGSRSRSRSWSWSLSGSRSLSRSESWSSSRSWSRSLSWSRSGSSHGG